VSVKHLLNRCNCGLHRLKGQIRRCSKQSIFNTPLPSFFKVSLKLIFPLSVLFFFWGGGICFINKFYISVVLYLCVPCVCGYMCVCLCDKWPGKGD
jgi:hypothetical protein